MRIEDYKINGRWATSKKIGGVTYHTFSSSKWWSMKKRAKATETDLKNRSYIGCSISREFLDFQTFTDWHTKQAGYGLEGYHLEKDIIIRGNKVYSPESCVLVPSELNAFILDSKRSRGEYPKGVSFRKDNGLFRAYVMINGKQKHLGLFDNYTEAHNSYIKAKNILRDDWVVRLNSGEPIVDPRVTKAIANWDFHD